MDTNKESCTRWWCLLRIYFKDEKKMKQEYKDVTIKRCFFPDGNLQSEIPYNKNGVGHGVGTFYDYDGETITIQVSYKNGDWHGLRTETSINGDLNYEIPYKNNTQHGIKIRFRY